MSSGGGVQGGVHGEKCRGRRAQGGGQGEDFRGKSEGMKGSSNFVAIYC